MRGLLKKLTTFTAAFDSCGLIIQLFYLTTMAETTTKKASTPSERTYGQRHVKGVALYDLVKDEAGYAPQNNPLITKQALQAFLAEVAAANTKVAELAPAYDAAQDGRVALYHGAEGLIKRAAMVRDVLGGYLNGKKSTAYLKVQDLVQEMRNYRQPKQKEVANGTDPAAGAAPASQAQLSFGSLLQKGKEVRGVMKDAATNYQTGNALVTVAAFEAFLQQLSDQNTVISEALKPLNAAIRERNRLVEGPEGLTERVAALKSHVAGEMGKGSVLHKELVKVRYS